MYDAKRIEELDNWLKAKNIDDIECMVADLAGIARGKSMPRVKFIEGLKTRGLRMPETVFGMTIHGDYAINEYLQEIDRDVILMPDLDTVCTTPWQPEPTAAVICDSVLESGEPVQFAPRQILKRVLDLYEAEGWQPIVAPEFEFYLIERQDNVESNPISPIGASGRRDVGSAPYSIDSLDEFAPYFDEVYDSCEAQNINVDTLIHEAGPAQFEFNVIHGPAMSVADQSFLFKRIIRQVAIRHNMFATFLASPYPEQYGSAMHIHQSVCDLKTGDNIFATEDGENSELFLSHIAGLQKYLHFAMPMIAPYPNSYRRFSTGFSSPTNTHWGRENRSVGLRVPGGPKGARRIENRVAGSDVNPYFAIATSLACGYLGMKEGLKASPEFKGNAYEANSRALPSHFLDGVNKMRRCEPLIEVLGEGFVQTYLEVKEKEYESYSAVLNPWEKRYLMLSV
ncbi:MAG: glutamine synthetase [Alphaproteobacteria bacterium]|nr:MAG: glutamine synthetase [Alphaproteobacteria bacterium]